MLPFAPSCSFAAFFLKSGPAPFIVSENGSLKSQVRGVEYIEICKFFLLMKKLEKGDLRDVLRDVVG